MWRLFYPLRYFTLINSEKRHLDAWPTLVLAALLAIPFIASPNAEFFAPNGFLDKLLVLTSALSGFYVAALLAVVTFPNADLDKVITIGPIMIKRKDPDGEAVTDRLTRREFTTTIFGYLAFISLVLSLLCAVAIPLTKSDVSPLARLLRIDWAFTVGALPYWHGVAVATFAALTAHMFVVTCLGFYFLMGRLYRRDPKVITKKPEKKDAA